MTSHPRHRDDTRPLSTLSRDAITAVATATARAVVNLLARVVVDHLDLPWLHHLLDVVTVVLW